MNGCTCRKGAVVRRCVGVAGSPCLACQPSRNDSAAPTGLLSASRYVLSHPASQHGATHSGHIENRWPVHYGARVRGTMPPWIVRVSTQSQASST